MQHSHSSYGNVCEGKSRTGSGYNAAAAPTCRQVPRQECQNIPRKQCTTVSRENYRNVLKQKCRTIQDNLAGMLPEKFQGKNASILLLKVHSQS